MSSTTPFSSKNRYSFCLGSGGFPPKAAVLDRSFEVEAAKKIRWVFGENLLRVFGTAESERGDRDDRVPMVFRRQDNWKSSPFARDYFLFSLKKKKEKKKKEKNDAV